MNEYLMNTIENDKVIKRLLGDYKHTDILELFRLLEELYLEHTSSFYFPGEICTFYPKIVEQRSRTVRYCNISGAKIMPGSFYYCYRPFLENLSSGKKYVLKKTICAEAGFLEFFPKTLFEFEQLSLNLTHPYNKEDTYYNYYELSKNLGEVLELQELHSKRKVKS